MTPSAHPRPPSAADLERLDADAWAELLPVVRAALHDLDDRRVTAAVQRLRAAPTGRLAGGRLRRELCDLLAADAALWRDVVDKAAARGHPAATWLAGREPAPEAAPEAPSRKPADTAPARDRERRDRDRLRRLKEERDSARRQAEGAQARIDTLEAEVARLEGELAAARESIIALEERLQSAADDQRRAVERESRRRDREVQRLRAELAELRRAEADRRRDEQERARSRERAEAQARAKADQRAARRQRVPRVVPGRPSRLPEGVAPDTVEAVELLLHPGRRVLVDGYNVTLRHRADLTLEEQRTWLVQQLAALARRRQVRPLVVFDGERGSAGRPGAGGRDVEVRFTAPGITADDELVLAVEATDEPVVVVTDDRELRHRLTASGADLVRTAPFVAAL